MKIRGYIIPILMLLLCLALFGANNLIFFQSPHFLQPLIKDPSPNHLLSIPHTPHPLPNSLLHPQQPHISDINSVACENAKSRQPESLFRVYMYDLPRKFTYGVVEQYYRARGMLTGPVLSDSSLQYPGTQHSAEWWLFSDLQKPQDQRLTSENVRVYDPSQADVFYVPFFSSLSLVVNPVGASKGGDYDDEKMQQELIEWLEVQETWVRNKGRDHVIICQDPNALRGVWDKVKRSILLVSDFGRFKPEQASLVKDVVLPYVHRINSYTHENAALERTTLLFFMGNRYRKEGGKIRGQLFELLEKEEDMVIKQGEQSRIGRRLAGQGMRTSKFCLHPAGDTPSACRLFDAIVSVCVPVIVSDYIELPFEDELDYTEFSIFVTSSKALKPGYLASLLRETTPDVLRQKQQRLREVRKYFEYEEPGGAVHSIWRQVKKKIPMVHLMINRQKRLAEDNNHAGCCYTSRS